MKQNEEDIKQWCFIGLIGLWCTYTNVGGSKVLISDGKQAISTCMLLIDQGLFENECLHSCWIATLHHIILLVERDRNQIFTYREILRLKLKWLKSSMSISSMKNKCTTSTKGEKQTGYKSSRHWHSIFLFPLIQWHAIAIWVIDVSKTGRVQKCQYTSLFQSTDPPFDWLKTAVILLWQGQC